MEARELRIGNYVNVPHGNVKIKHLTEYGAHFEDDCGGNWNSLDAIPLTPEWLERFGFEREMNLLRNHPLFIKQGISLCHESKTFSVSMQGILGAYPLRTKIQYIHQLQNLYFALTGEELELKS